MMIGPVSRLNKLNEAVIGTAGGRLSISEIKSGPTTVNPNFTHAHENNKTLDENNQHSFFAIA